MTRDTLLTQHFFVSVNVRTMVAGETLCTCGVEWKGGDGERRVEGKVVLERALGSANSDLHTHSNSTVRTMV
jgi:hypothetical protein